MTNVNIFCTRHNYKTVGQTIQRYSENGNFSIFIYCPESDIYFLSEYLNGSGFFHLKSDFEIDPNGKFFEIIKSWSKQGVTNYPGWCYQQYLKLKLVEASQDLLVIMDGDTYVDPIYLHNCIESKVVTSTLENVETYNKMFKNVKLGINIRETSYIANFGIISPNLFKANFESVDNLFLKIYKYSIEKNVQFTISEYQIFGNIMLDNNWKSRSFKFFRRGDLLPINFFGLTRIINIANFLGFNAIAFEANHSRNFINKIIAPIVFIFRFSW
jgi:hypothetical protein